MRVRAPQIEQLVTDRIRQLFGEPASLIEAAEPFRLQATLPLDTALVIPTRVRASARVGGQKTPRLKSVSSPISARRSSAVERSIARTKAQQLDSGFATSWAK
jgi:hypothetical protein